MPESPQHNESFLRRHPLLATGAVGVIALVGAERFDMFDFPRFNFRSPIEFKGAPRQPEQATGAVRHDTYEVASVENIACGPNISVGVEVTAEADGWRLPVVGNLFGVLGDGKVNKIYYLRFLGCSDKNTMNTSITKTVDEVTGKVVGIQATLPGLEVTMPHISELDSRNCASLRPGDTKSVIIQKVNERNEKITAGQNVYCDYGFKVSGGVAPSDVADAKDIGRAAAELAVSLDARIDATNAKVIQAKDQIRRSIEDELTGKYGVRPTVIDQSILMTDAERLKDRFDRISDKVRDRFVKYGFGKNKQGDLFFFATGAGGEKATVNFRGDTKITKSELAALNTAIRDVKQPNLARTAKG